MQLYINRLRNGSSFELGVTDEQRMLLFRATAPKTKLEQLAEGNPVLATMEIFLTFYSSALMYSMVAAAVAYMMWTYGYEPALLEAVQIQQQNNKPFLLYSELDPFWVPNTTLISMIDSDKIVKLATVSIISHYAIYSFNFFLIASVLFGFENVRGRKVAVIDLCVLLALTITQVVQTMNGTAEHGGPLQMISLAYVFAIHFVVSPMAVMYFTVKNADKLFVKKYAMNLVPLFIAAPAAVMKIAAPMYLEADSRATRTIVLLVAVPLLNEFMMTLVRWQIRFMGEEAGHTGYLVLGFASVFVMFPARFLMANSDNIAEILIVNLGLMIWEFSMRINIKRRDEALLTCIYGADYANTVMSHPCQKRFRELMGCFMVSLETAMIVASAAFIAVFKIATTKGVSPDLNLLAVNVMVQFLTEMTVDVSGHIYESRVNKLSLMQGFANRYKYETGFTILALCAILPAVFHGIVKAVSAKHAQTFVVRFLV